MIFKYLYTFIFILGISVLGLLTPPYFIIELYRGFANVVLFSFLTSFFLAKGLLNFQNKVLWDWFNLVLLLIFSTFIAQVFNAFVLNGLHEINEAFFHQVIRNGYISAFIGFPLLLWIPTLVTVSFRFFSKKLQQKLIIKKESIPIKTRLLLSLGLSLFIVVFLFKIHQVSELDRLKSIENYEHIMNHDMQRNEIIKESKNVFIKAHESQIENQKPKLETTPNSEKETDVDTLVKNLLERMECHDMNKFHEITKNDLNYDGIDEIIIFNWGLCFCGTGGCNTRIYQYHNDKLKLVGSFIQTRVPFYLKKEPNTQWKDIVFFISGGGATSIQRTYRFKDGEYKLLKETPSTDTLYYEFIEKSKNDENLERIFDDAYEKIYKKPFNQ